MGASDAVENQKLGGNSLGDDIAAVECSAIEIASLHRCCQPLVSALVRRTCAGVAARAPPPPSALARDARSTVTYQCMETRQTVHGNYPGDQVGCAAARKAVTSSTRLWPMARVWRLARFDHVARARDKVQVAYVKGEPGEAGK